MTSVNYGSAEGKLAKVSITDGTVNGELGTYTYNNGLTATTDAAKATIAVTGGTFSNDPPSTWWKILLLARTITARTV